MTIESRIKLQREAKRYSQEYMATRLNITQASYSRIESGVTKPDVKKLKVICELLDISVFHVFANDQP